MGYASTLVDKATYRNQADWKRFWGFGNLGTNIVAETMAYVLPLMYLISEQKKLNARKLHIFTDCEHLLWSANNRMKRKRNRQLWAMVDSFRASGLEITWHWIPRDTIELNKFGHNLANAARIAGKDLDKQVLADMNAQSVKELQPHGIKKRRARRRAEEDNEGSARDSDQPPAESGDRSQHRRRRAG